MIALYKLPKQNINKVIETKRAIWNCAHEAHIPRRVLFCKFQKILAARAHVFIFVIFWYIENITYSQSQKILFAIPGFLLLPVVGLRVILGVLALIVLNFIFRRFSAGKKVHGFFEKFSNLGSIFVRVAIALAFFFGAKSGTFLGPELTLSQMPLAVN